MAYWRLLEKLSVGGDVKSSGVEPGAEPAGPWCLQHRNGRVRLVIGPSARYREGHKPCTATIVRPSGGIRTICTSKITENGSVKGSFALPADTNAATRVGAHKRPKKKVPKTDQMATRRSLAVQPFTSDTLKAPRDGAHR